MKIQPIGMEQFAQFCTYYSMEQRKSPHAIVWIERGSVTALATRKRQLHREAGAVTGIRNTNKRRV